MRARAIAERFWSKVRKADGCWLWTGRTDDGGYGRFDVGRTNVGAHRVAWELTNGPIPEGMDVCHSCDNPPCCNPAHFWLGTQVDNIADMNRKGRNGHAAKTQCPRGHAYDAANTIVEDGSRSCRQCRLDRQRARYNRNITRERKRVRDYQQRRRSTITHAS